MDFIFNSLGTPVTMTFRELIAFHQRYTIDMRQLAAFKAPENDRDDAHERAVGEAASTGGVGGTCPVVTSPRTESFGMRPA